MKNKEALALGFMGLFVGALVGLVGYTCEIAWSGGRINLRDRVEAIEKCVVELERRK